MTTSYKETLLSPLFKNNPITLQILGICSALAVTTSLQVTLVMCIALTSVVCFYIKDFNFLNSIFFGFLISTFTQFGDLFESWIKRKHLVKDFL